MACTCIKTHSSTFPTTNVTELMEFYAAPKNKLHSAALVTLWRGKLNILWLKKFNKMQLYGNIYLLLNYSTCFGRPSHPSSGVHKTAVAASGTEHNFLGSKLLQVKKLASQIVMICTRSGWSLWYKSQLSGKQASSSEEACFPDSYDLYQRLQLQFYELLMMGAIDARNM